ncbi:tetratricopeptide repeat protein [Paenibacillus humicola]|uniref:tetratricopeptide repeat protein n=1 Tax=Paenibacillus humicola TaxID=3110540 RepID=UPI00237B81FE|nr:tetratricopeptide repeat protein [Paenibacillus humicola]
MFKHVFGVMHEMLDDIMIRYPYADSEQKRQLDEQLSMLKQYSDTFIEDWLLFEEKMADVLDLRGAGAAGGSGAPIGSSKKAAEQQEHPWMPPAGGEHSVYAAGKQLAASAEAADYAAEAAEALGCSSGTAAGDAAMSKGQGYFKLLMFGQAARHFEEAVGRSPEDNRARLFLAMTYMHLQEWNEAQRHFQLIVELTDHAKWRALGYNALGCIQAIRMNLEQAERYFVMAHEADPDFADPLTNLKSCRQHSGHLSLYFGSGQL